MRFLLRARAVATGTPRVVAAILLVFLIFAWLGFSSGQSVVPGTVAVIRGDYVETLILRGEIKASNSRLVIAPSGAGDLQIVALTRTHSQVARGDVVVEFDKTEVTRRLVESRMLLRQAQAEIDKAEAQMRIEREVIHTEQSQGRFDVERSRLHVGTREVISDFDAAKADVELSDAEQRLREADTKLESVQLSQRAMLRGLTHKRNKAAADVALAERQLERLTVRAPVAGQVILQTLFRSQGSESEYREGDRAYAGAVIGEIPDGSRLYVAARVDEVDRGRLVPGMSGTVMVDALQGMSFNAKVTAFSTLPLPDFGSPWPMPHYFIATMALDALNPRVGPGMSATVRMEVDRLAGVLLAPREAIFQKNGGSLAYVAAGSGFEARPVTVARWGPREAAITGGLDVGERVFVIDPTVRSGQERSNGRLPALSRRASLP
jgi:HlyD family secretion protein